MPLRDVKYKRDQSILKVYGYGCNKKIKLINLSCLRTSGIEDVLDYGYIRCTVNDEKLDDNIIRTKNKIFELAFCNPWQYFFTGTLNKEFYDRTNLEKWHKDLTQWLRDQGRKYGNKIDFLLIPELHEDGQSWHIHGFLNGLSDEVLVQFRLGQRMGKALAEKVKNGDTVYNWPAYQKKFGFCDLEPIRNYEAISKYITKYINKNLAKSVKELNAHLYYHSRGLKFAEVINKGACFYDMSSITTYVGDYVRVAWLDYDENLLKEIDNSFKNVRYTNYEKYFGG